MLRGLRLFTHTGKVLDLLPANSRRHAYVLLALFILTATSELASVSAVLPLVAAAADPQAARVNPWVSSFAIHTGIRDPRHLVSAFGLIFMGLYALATLLTALSWGWCLKFSADVSHHLCSTLLTRYLHRPHAWFFSRNTTELLRRVLDDTSHVVEHVVLPVTRGISQCLTAVFVCGGLLWLEPKVAITSASTITLLYILTYRFFVGRIERLGRLSNQLDAQRYKIADESLTIFKGARIGPRRRSLLARFSSASEDFLQVRTRHRVIGDLPRYVTELLAIGTIVVVFIYLAWSGHSTTQTISFVCFYIMAVWRVVPALQRVYGNAIEIGFYMPAVEAVREELNDAAVLVPEADGPRLELSHSIALRNVTFRYTSDTDPAIANLDLVIARGAVVALVGRTGCGKSTLADIVSGYLDPTAGTVEIDGVVLDGPRVQAWQRNIGYVPQDIFLVDDTVTRNVALGIADEAIDVAAVERACRQACIHDFLAGLADGYATVLGERGVCLSGGQRQRIGIARALYHEPQMLILDEATSALDNQTEFEVMRAVDALAADRTVLVIAHRLSTVESCGDIVLLDAGRLVGRGTWVRAHRFVRIAAVAGPSRTHRRGGAGSMRIVPVRTWTQVRQFLALPHRVHRQFESRWIAPLNLHVRSMMGRLDSPDRRFLLAFENDRAVARIGVKVHEGYLHFGFFECIPGHDETVRALVQKAHSLAPQMAMRGPFHFTLEDPFTGLLTEGFDEEPYFLMPYNPPWYAATLAASGLRPIKSLHTYAIDQGTARYDKMTSRAVRAREKGITVRVMDRSRIPQEVRTIASIFEDALADNWGFEPFNDRTLGELQMMARFVPEKWGVMIARRDGVDIGCLIVIPNFNEILRDVQGRLLPRLLWRYWRREALIGTFRGYALGVRKAQRSDEVAAALVDHLSGLGQLNPWKRFELGWVLEDNFRMAALAMAMGAKRNKVYQILERPAQ